ncbi:hypothetical protein CPB83DRAFT_856540 [Crepidotus variabilis]|uniref:LysM domain-containing protein n=1 Tax=Crepidotus variabilis TaxID=179855 RepID=A0A9P6EEA1_9AGAR|nr:hypothetical protein CPB83DRAFT_856540 [Crepidotus variabilis]
MFSKIFAIAAVLAFSVQSAVAADCSRSYTVKEGDYCDKISAANNASTFQLAAANSGKMNSQCTDLKVGADLCLGNKGEDCQTTYTVKGGDTCNTILYNANINATILYLNNPQIDEKCSNIYVGEVLCTSQTVQVSPIPAGGVVVPVSGPPATPPAAPANGGAPPAPSTAITVTAAATPAANIVPAATPAPATPVNAAPIPAAGDDDCDDDGADDGADDDDADLPFCDEVDQ